VELRIYTTGMVCVAETYESPVPGGWSQIPLPADFIQNAASGVYFCRLQSFRAGSAASRSLLVKIMILR
jgi:hypothetical protein